MHRRSLLVAVVLLAGMAVLAQEKAANLPSEETVNAFLQQTFGYDSTVTWKITAIKPSIAEGLAEVNVTLTNAQGQSGTTLYVTPDGKHALTGEIMPFGAKPYAPAKEALLKGINGPGRGPEKSAVTIVEFSDLQCPHCKDAQPVIEKLLAEEPNARFVFQNYPLPMHNWAAKAAYYADCVGRSSNDAFWKFVQGTFDQQTNLTESNAEADGDRRCFRSEGRRYGRVRGQAGYQEPCGQVGCVGDVGWSYGNADCVRERTAHRERGGRASRSPERPGGVRGEAVVRDEPRFASKGRT